MILYFSTENDLSQPLLWSDHHQEYRYQNLVDIDRIENKGGILLYEKVVPRHLRHIFPMVVIGTILMLLASNLSVGASVDVVISSDDHQDISVPSVFAFSLGNTVRGMYRAGIYPLMLLVVVFSGLWPYLKLVLMLFGWFAPTRILDVRSRGRMLFLLDALGKFSLVDTFVMIIMMVSFHYHLDLEGLMTLNVFVNPRSGFNGFLYATTLSLVAGHVVQYFHRRSQAVVKVSSQEKECLRQHEFEDEERDTQWRLTGLFSTLIMLIIVLAIVLLSIGITRKSFIFEFGGLAGKLLGEDRIKSYSLLTLGSSLPESVEDPSSLEIKILQTAFFFYTVIMPFTCLATLSVLFLKPMTLPDQQKVMAVAEIANAWSAVEVFALSIIAALVEISTFASFMIGHKCDLINAFLANNFDDIMDGDATCYTVSSSVSSDVWYLVCGALLNSFAVSILLKLAHRAIDDRIHREEDLEKDLLATDAHISFDLITSLLHSRLSCILFENTITEENEGVRQMTRSDSQFWETWREICSFT